MTKDKLKTASVLAFERKLDPSDALFFSGSWDNRADSQAWQKITIREKAVRGTISNRLKTKDIDPAKLDAKIDDPNLQTVDVAALPNNADTLKVQFTLRVLGGAGIPSACNSLEYLQQLQTVIDAYKKQQTFSALAQRYAYNLANARFLWRNRIGAEQVEVIVKQLKQGKAMQKWSFQALDLSLRNFDIVESSKENLNDLGRVIQSGLEGQEYVLLEVIAFARIGNGQEVFPSQELILDNKSEKSKTLYKVDEITALHSQKVGNALRTIDTWYSKKENNDVGPISVEPYGSVTSLGKAFRKPQDKLDFYSLLDNWIIHNIEPEIVQQHFVMANLIRGGVFGESEKKE